MDLFLLVTYDIPNDLVMYLLQDLTEFLNGIARQDQQEFLTAVPHRIAMIEIRVFPVYGSHHTDDLISGQMSVGIVDTLKLVDIQQRHGQTLSVHNAFCTNAGEDLVKVSPVVYSGQTVLHGHVLHLQIQLCTLYGAGEIHQRRFIEGISGFKEIRSPGHDHHDTVILIIDICRDRQSIHYIRVTEHTRQKIPVFAEHQRIRTPPPLNHVINGDKIPFQCLFVAVISGKDRTVGILIQVHMLFDIDAAGRRILQFHDVFHHSPSIFRNIEIGREVFHHLDQGTDFLVFVGQLTVSLYQIEFLEVDFTVDLLHAVLVLQKLIPLFFQIHVFEMDVRCFLLIHPEPVHKAVKQDKADTYNGRTDQDLNDHPDTGKQIPETQCHTDHDQKQVQNTADEYPKIIKDIIQDHIFVDQHDLKQQERNEFHGVRRTKNRPA